jgi:hypothetical protein
VEERRLRVGSLFEWLLAATGVAVLIWLISVPVQRVIGPQVEAAPVVEPSTALPPGVPPSAVSVPVMLLLDGREIRAGDSHTRVHNLLPDKLAEGPMHISANGTGERHTRLYVVDGTRFYVVCERTDNSGPMRVLGVYLP